MVDQSYMYVTIIIIFLFAISAVGVLWSHWTDQNRISILRVSASSAEDNLYCRGKLGGREGRGGKGREGKERKGMGRD